MRYKKIVEGIFLERPNRFIAKVALEGREEIVHVKNTGRCRELLTYGATVYLSDETDKDRKTGYDLVAVNKNGRIINMDSQAPNMVVKEALQEGKLLGEVAGKQIKPEYTYGDSRFDFYVKGKIETDTEDGLKNGSEEIYEEILIEVKGVTLENDNICSFPDAPSDRAVKHIEELIKAKKEGYRTIILFVIQITDVKFLIPNDVTHPAFGEALQKAKEAGVEILAFDSIVCKDSLVLNREVPVFLYYKEEYHKMVSPLMEWYYKGHRILPWRSKPDGYRVWISEIMLQQTRVEAVKPYFERFMEALPDIHELAKVSEERLLKLWEGLGYYNRARNLKKAATVIMEEYDGRMPETFDDLLKLPGIGTYTAGAISSIAFGKKVPAVDGNVLRILSRLTMDEGDILKDSTKRMADHRLREVLPDNTGDFNQALMELGAMVCIPVGKPKCDICPWVEICQAHKQGAELQFPKKEVAKQRKIEKKTILVIEDENKYVLHKRPEKGLLAGLYEFPAMEGHIARKDVLNYLEELGLQVLKIRKAESFRHVFTHKEWDMHSYIIKVDELAQKGERLKDEKWIFVEGKKAREEYPIPAAFSFCIKYLGGK